MTVEAVLYLVHESRGYRIKVVGDIARIERQAHGGFAAASQKAYPYPHILESEQYWEYSQCAKLIKRYERDIVRELEKKRLKAISRIAPDIRAALFQLIRGKSDRLESGYEIARELKELGYTYEEVGAVAASICTPNIRAGIRIEFIGLYD